MARDGHLRFRIEYADDSGIELVASAVSDGFSGTATAWFSRECIAYFADRLASTYPIPPGEVIDIRSDHFLPPEAGEDPVRLRIAFDAIGHRGAVRCTIRLADDRDFDDHHTFRQCVRMTLPTTYEAVRTFALELRALLDGVGRDAALHEAEH